MTIYALHGWAYSTDKWVDFEAELKARDIKLKLLEIPGLTAELKSAWDIDDYINWLAQELPDKPVVLLGHSNGGRLALNFAWLYPERVEKLILLDSAGVYHGGWAKLKREAFKRLAKAGKKLTKSPKARKLLYKIARVSDYNKASEKMKKVMDNMLRSDQSLRLEEIGVETNIIWGALDKVTPVTDGVIMQQRLANSELRVVEDGRHSPHFTHAAEVADLVRLAVKQ